MTKVTDTMIFWAQFNGCGDTNYWVNKFSQTRNELSNAIRVIRSLETTPDTQVEDRMVYWVQYNERLDIDDWINAFCKAKECLRKAIAIIRQLESDQHEEEITTRSELENRVANLEALVVQLQSQLSPKLGE